MAPHYYHQLLLLLVLFTVLHQLLGDRERKRLELKSGEIVYGSKVVKGNRNAIYFLDSSGSVHFFPDFYTFTTLGFATGDIKKISDEKLASMPVGEPIKALPAPPPFRPDDATYHDLCEDHPRMLDTLGLVPHIGNFDRYLYVMQRIQRTKTIDILALGGSITAGGYYEEFVRLLRTNDNYTVNVHNHGHGATEITYTIYCVDVDKYEPDVVLIDFAVNDYGHPKLMDALVRKMMSFKSAPLVVLVNLWANQHCVTPRYLLHAHYYDIPLISVCPAANLCFGKRLPTWIQHQYSKTDGIHPWGPQGVPFIGNILYAWWKRYEKTVFDHVDLLNQDLTQPHIIVDGHSVKTMAAAFSITPVQQADKYRFSHLLYADNNSKMGAPAVPVGLKPLPPPLYTSNPIGACTRCDALVDDADAQLEPYGPPIGFRVVTRMKIGYGGFNPADKNASTKSFKRSWQADTAGSSISFKFYGSSVKLAMWQRRDSMGVIHAYIDGDKKRIAKASGFFKGYTWAMERNNTGRSEIVSLFDDLEDKEHVVTFLVSDEPANVWVKGHLTQIFALLSASNNPQCKNVTFAKA